MDPTTASARRREPTVHLNTAGHGRVSADVRAAVLDCARREDRYGPHATQEALGDVLHGGVQTRIGALLGGAPAALAEVVTSASAAFEALIGTLALTPGDRIWTTPYESPARLATLYGLRDRARCRLEVVPLRADGDLDLEWMADRIDDSVALVSVVHVPSALGIVNPVEELGRILAPHRCLYAVDASYSLGQLPVDVRRIGCDLLTCDGWRFLGGPDSVGLAHVTPRLRTAPRRDDGHGRRSMPAPENAAVVGLDAALAHHARTLTAHHARTLTAHHARTLAADRTRAERGTDVRSLRRQLWDVVERAEGFEAVAPGRVQSGILAFRHPELPAALLRRELAARGVVVWKTVAQEVPGYLPGQGIGTLLRASVHVDNTPQDIARFADALTETVRAQRRRSSSPRTGAVTYPARSSQAQAAAVGRIGRVGGVGRVGGAGGAGPTAAGARPRLTVVRPAG